MKFRRIAKCLGAGALCAGSVVGQSSESGGAGLPERQVTLYLNNSQIVRCEVVAYAEHLATRLFEPIGVRLRWKLGLPSDREATLGAGCSGRPWGILVEFVTGSPANSSESALALTFPYEEHQPRIVVLADRFTSLLEYQLRPAAIQLGYALAHEIGHVLQGISRHSVNGIMQAHWTERDYVKMMDNVLLFSPGDVDLIHLGMATRQARSCRKPGAQTVLSSQTPRSNRAAVSPLEE